MRSTHITSHFVFVEPVKQILAKSSDTRSQAFRQFYILDGEDVCMPQDQTLIGARALDLEFFANCFFFFRLMGFYHVFYKGFSHFKSPRRNLRLPEICVCWVKLRNTPTSERLEGPSSRKILARSDAMDQQRLVDLRRFQCFVWVPSSNRRKT